MCAFRLPDEPEIIPQPFQIERMSQLLMIGRLKQSELFLAGSLFLPRLSNTRTSGKYFLIEDTGDHPCADKST